MSDISLEDLLKALEENQKGHEASPPKSEEVDKDVRFFIRYFDLKEGEKRVPTFVLWFLFKRWSKMKRGKIRITKKKFFNGMSKLFTRSRYGYQRFYNLEDNNEFTDELYQSALKNEKPSNGKRKIRQKRKQKKSL